MMNNDPPHTQYASTSGVSVPGLEGWRSISAKTGLNLETVAGLGLTDSLSCLFGADGKLRDGAELRSREAAGTLGHGPTAEQRRLQLMDKRWPRKRLSPQQQQVELMRLKGEWFAEFS
jgi:hypothetical protein